MEARPRQFTPAPPPSGPPIVDAPSPAASVVGAADRARRDFAAAAVALLLAVGGMFLWLLLQIDYGFRSLDPPVAVDLLGVGALVLLALSAMLATASAVQSSRLDTRHRTGAGGDLDWLRVRAGALSDEVGPEPVEDPGRPDAHARWVAGRRTAVTVLVDAARGDADALAAAARHAYAMTADRRVAGLLSEAAWVARRGAGRPPGAER